MAMPGRISPGPGARRPDSHLPDGRRGQASKTDNPTMTPTLKKQDKKTARTTPAWTIAWPELVQGTLVQRYKRFLADIKLDDGRVVTAHCPNSGAMTGCSRPGRRAWMSRHDNPRRKLKYTWELIDMPTSLVGVNTLVPNRLVAGAIAAGDVPPLAGYRHVAREVTTGTSRLDIRLTAENRADCYVEVKNCTLVENGTARFPDARTTRGLKHLRELERLAAEGHRSVIFFLVQRMDAHRFAPADRIDPAYAAGLRHAVNHGVEIHVYDVCMDLKTIAIRGSLPHLLDP
jgi:sugar fermentation stimulation protein A